MIVLLFITTLSVLIATCSGFSKMVVGLVGDSVTLPCKYDIATYGTLNICWGRHQSWFSCENTLISTDGSQVNYRESHRFSLSSGINRGDVSLTIRAVESSDAGLYVCRIEIPGLFNDISDTVYLLISNKLDTKTVISETQMTPTTSKQEELVNHVTDHITLNDELYLISAKTSTDVTDIHIGKSIAVAHTEERVETFVINVVRVGSVVFIPGLITTLLFRLRRSREHSSSTGV